MMSIRRRGGSHDENDRRTTELQDGPAHEHRVADLSGKQEHLTGHEHSRQVLEHSSETQPEMIGHGVGAFGRANIAALAYRLWQARGCPGGSAEEDWHHAVEQLRSWALDMASTRPSPPAESADT